jgi:hypothetical protein
MRIVSIGEPLQGKCGCVGRRDVLAVMAEQLFSHQMLRCIGESAAFGGRKREACADGCSDQY